MIINDFRQFLVTSKGLDASRRSRTLSGGDWERRLRRIKNTPQREVIEVNEADDALLGDQEI